MPTHNALLSLPLFSGVSEAEKDGLLKGGRIRQCPRDEIVFTHGGPVTHFYIIMSGTIQLFRTSADGKEKTVEVLKSGQTICENEILDACHHHRVNAKPIEDTVVMEFPVAWLKESAKKYPAFAINLLSLIASQVHMAEVEAEHQATMSAAQLIACFLQRLCVLYDYDPKEFELPYSKALIASRLGMEPETFSRTLVKLKDHGIMVEGTHVRITDLARIEQYVCNFCSVSEECTTHQTMEKKMRNGEKSSNPPLI